METTQFHRLRRCGAWLVMAIALVLVLGCDEPKPDPTPDTRVADTVSAQDTAIQDTAEPDAGTPAVEASPTTIALGDVSSGATSQQTLTLRNTGDGTLEVTRVLIRTDANIELQLNTLRVEASQVHTFLPTIELTPGQSVRIEVVLYADDPGQVFADLVFTTNDPTEDVEGLVVPVTASVVAP